MSNLALRLLTVALLAPALLAAIFWRRHEAWWGIVFLATIASLHELGGICLAGRRERGLLLGAGAAVAAVLYWVPAALPAAIAATALVALGAMLASPDDMRGAAERAALVALGVLYAGVLTTYVALVKRLPDGSWWLFLTLTIPWFGDTGAYFTGRAIGRHKLYPKVSPGKTWEGAFGGLAGSLIAAVAAKLLYLPALGWLDCVALALPAGALGQVGDLCESLLKRAWGVKDSGKLLPGHGGMLDRIDALVFAAPYVYAYAGWVTSRG